MQFIGMARACVCSATGTAGIERRLARRAAAHSAGWPALVAQLAHGGALVCPVRRGEREVLMRFAGGRREAVA